MEWRTGARRPAAGLAVLSLVVGLLVVGAAAGGAAEGARVRVGPAPAVLPHGARTLGSLPADQTVHVDLVLQGQDPAGLDAFTAAVSTPSSPDYRQYLSAGQFAARFGPAPAAVASVGAWLTSAGLRPGASEDGGLVLQADGPAAAVAAAFGTPLDAVELSSGARSYANTTAPTLPAEVAGAVRAVAGLDGLARFHPQVVLEPKAHGTGTPAARLHPSVGPQPCAAAAAAASTGSLTANQFASVYGLSGLYGQGRSGAGVNVGIYELEPYTPSDVATYQQCYGLTNRIHTVLVDGGASGPQSGEAALDIETVGALAPGATLTVYEAPNDASGPLDEWATIASQDSTKVVTTSWGNCEALIGSFATAEAPLFQQMAAQGQTVVAAAGDTGSEGCFPDTLSTGLGVSDPSSQVYVTGVGGTSFKSGLPPNESVWNDCQGTGSSACALAGAGGSGGGGLSSLWAMPSWQTGPGVANGFSNGEREVPDVSADADPGTGYVFFLGGTWIGNAGGTSAAVLVWAATTAVIDQGCAQPVGFANPALYALGTAGTGFSDVTLGNNDFTDTNIPPKYPATANYDLASGWGTPQGGALATGLQPAGGCPTVTSISSGGGPVQGGSTMTISGSSLGGATQVSFGHQRPAQILSNNGSQITVVVPAAPGSIIVDVTVTNPAGTSAATGADRYIFGTPPTGYGYWLNASDGGVFAFGNAPYDGSMGGKHLNAPVVGMATVPGNVGYWEVAADGGIFGFGKVGYYGSMGGKPLARPIVAMVATPSGQGYWEVASDGGIFAFGDAKYYGSMGGKVLDKPVVGMAATPSGQGYWEVASDGGLFAFGDAKFYGSMGGKPLNQPVVGIAASPDGTGYWEVASDGGLFAFGPGAPFFGSMGGIPLNKPIVAIAPAPDADGYWEVASDGGLFSFGSANFFGSTGNLVLVAPIVAMSPS